MDSVGIVLVRGNDLEPEGTGMGELGVSENSLECGVLRADGLAMGGETHEEAP